MALGDVIDHLLEHRRQIGGAIWEYLALLKSQPEIAVEKIAEKTGRKSTRSVQMNIRRLEKAGLVEKRGRPGGSNYYSIQRDNTK